MQYAISDIHGCCKTFKALINRLKLQKEDQLFLLGDYIDRGPNSKGVIDFIFKLKKSGFQITTLKGNHEAFLLDAYHNKNEHIWLKNGGNTTLESFAINHSSQIPEKYIAFVENLQLYVDHKAFILVHASINLQEENPFEDEDALLWKRETIVDNTVAKGRKIIHGHTPMPVEDIYLDLKKQVVGIDAGCVYTDHPGLGNLCALNLTEEKLIIQKNIE